MTDYDVAVIGAGVCGSATAWTLAHYNLKVALIDRCADAGFGVSKANSGIIHGGFHHPKSMLKSALELQGNELFDQLQKELHFEFVRCGILVIAYSREELEPMKKLYEQGVANGVPGIELCDAKRLRELEPKLAPEACGGFYVPRGGVIEPYGYVFSLVESCEANGVEFWRNFQLVSSKRSGEFRELSASDGRTIRARFTVNAAGLHADEVSRICGGEEFQILCRKGEEYLLDRTSPGRPSKVLFPVPTPCSKGMLVIPTAGGTTMIGPTAVMVDSKADTGTTDEERKIIYDHAKKMISGISERDQVACFSGLRPVLPGNGDFMIRRSKCAPDLFQVAGVQSPGLTASPAIGLYVTNLLKEAGLKLEKKTSFNPLPETGRAREMTPEELEKKYAEDPRWTKIVCRCEFVSEAEIAAAVRRGHTTLDGVKFATRAGMGRCQGGFCGPKIMKIICQEGGIAPEKLTKRGGKSNLLAGTLGDMEVK